MICFWTWHIRVTFKNTSSKHIFFHVSVFSTYRCKFLVRVASIAAFTDELDYLLSSTLLKVLPIDI